MAQKVDLTGKTFHWLTVIRPIGIENRHRVWECKCKCGKKVKRTTGHLNENVKHSCGCRGWIYHHDYGTHFYRKYGEAKKRCSNPNVDSYKYYGGKGIKFEWKSYSDFKKDMYESYKIHVEKYGEKNTSLERIDGNGNYCKENCRWATWKEQILNRSNMHEIYYMGNKISIEDLEKTLGLPPKSVRSKLSRGVPIEWIINNPHKRYFKHERYKVKAKQVESEMQKYIH